MTRILARIWNGPGGRLGLTLSAAVVLFALLGPLLAPDPDLIDVLARLEGPSLAHPLGTDNIGRDQLARLALGTRTAFLYALVIIAISATAGSLFGIAMGMAGGWTDRIGTAVFDIASAFPPLILAFGLIALYGSSPAIFIILVAVVFTPSFGRTARARTLSLRHQSFIEAEQLLGLPPWRIMLVHVLPNVLPAVLVMGSMLIPSVITIEAGLSFLGLGVRPPAASLGTIIKDGYQFLNLSPWIALNACLVLAAATLGSTLLGESLRRILDPKSAA